MLSVLPLLALLTSAAPQPLPPGTWVVLVKTEPGVPAGWVADLQTAVERAAQDDERIQILPPPAVGLDDIQLTLSCDGWGPACAGQVAEMISAKYAFSIRVKVQGEGATLSWQLVSANGKVVRQGPTTELSDRGDPGLAAARSTLRAAVLGRPATVLVVESDVPGAELFLDGQRVGTTPFTAHDIEPGTHKVRLTYEGRAPLTQELQVVEGQVNKRRFVLSAGPPPHYEPTLGDSTASAEPLVVSPALAWAVTGVGATLLVGGVGLYAVHVATGLWFSRWDYIQFGPIGFPTPVADRQPDFLARQAMAGPAQPFLVPIVLGIWGAAGVVATAGLLAAVSGGFLVWSSLPEEGEAEPPPSAAEPAPAPAPSADPPAADPSADEAAPP